MTQEVNVSTGAETQNQAPAADEHRPEVVTPEPQDATPETPAEDQPEAAKEDDRDKAIKRMERRINLKHAQAAAAEERARMLEQRLASYENQRAPAQGDQSAAPTQEQIQEFVRQEAQRITEAQETSRRVADVVKAGEKIPGWDEACITVQEEIPMVDRNGRPSEFAKAVLEADNPAKLMHHLGNNPELLADLQGLTPSALGRKLDRIEREMSAPKTSAAPKPLSPVKPSASKGAPDPSDTEAYIEWRRKQRANT